MMNIVTCLRPTSSMTLCRPCGPWPITAVAVLLAIGAGVGPADASGDIPIASGPPLKINPPLPVWPSDYETITDATPTFRMNGRFGATRYRVEVAQDAAFSDPVTLRAFRVIEETGITPVVEVSHEGEPLPEGRHYWRAFCGDDEGFETPPANYRVFFVSEEDVDRIVPPELAEYPRLIFRTDEVAGLRERISRSEQLTRGWRYQVNAAYGSLELEPPDERYAQAGAGQHGNYSSAASWYHRHLQNIAFVGIVTGDQAMIRKGVEMLMTACAYERWLGPHFDDPERFDPPWHSALETAMMTTAVALGYDMLHAHLTEAQREIVREAIAEKGVRPLVREWADPVGSSRLPRHQVPTGNWVMVCSASAGIGALALLGEHPEAAEWVRLVRNRVRAWLKDRGGDYYVDNPWRHNRPDPIPVIGPSEPNFGIDGGYKESISYMNYAMVYVSSFADSLRQVTGENLFEHVPEGILDPLAWSLMGYAEEGGQRFRMVDFGDCWANAAWYGNLLTAMIKHRRDGRAAWLYGRLNPVPNTPRILLAHDDTVPEAPPDAALPMKVFRGIGQVIMRSGWSADTPMAAIKFHQNRGHHDIGTFFLYGAGGPTVIDSGPAPYGSPIYGSYSAQSVAHNLVLVNDRSQVRANGTILAAIGTSEMTAASGQLAAAYPDELASWTRDLLMLPDRQALIIDRLEAAGDAEHRFDLVLHPEHPFTVAGDDEIAVGDSPSTWLRVLSDGAFQVREQDGYYMTIPRKYVRFDGVAPARERAFVTLCQWPDVSPGRRPRLIVQQPESDRWHFEQEGPRSRLSVRVGGARDERIVTDGRVAAVWEAGTRSRRRHAILLHATRLAIDGHYWFHATAPVNVGVELDLPLRAMFAAAEPARITLRLDERVRVARLNGERVGGRIQRGLVSFDIPAGESEFVAGEFDRPVDRLPPLRFDDLAVRRTPDAPAFRAGVRTRASTSFSAVIDALDGDVNTGWVSLPGAPMPQWMEVTLPEPEPMEEAFISTGGPTAGRLEVWDEGRDAWKKLGTFETTPEAASTTVSFERGDYHRLRLVVERIDPVESATRIQLLRWHVDPQTRPAAR